MCSADCCDFPCFCGPDCLGGFLLPSPTPKTASLTWLVVGSRSAGDDLALCLVSSIRLGLRGLRVAREDNSWHPSIVQAFTGILFASVSLPTVSQMAKTRVRCEGNAQRHAYRESNDSCHFYNKYIPQASFFSLLLATLPPTSRSGLCACVCVCVFVCSLHVSIEETVERREVLELRVAIKVTWKRVWEIICLPALICRLVRITLCLFEQKSLSVPPCAKPFIFSQCIHTYYFIGSSLILKWEKKDVTALYIVCSC